MQKHYSSLSKHYSSLQKLHWSLQKLYQGFKSLYEPWKAYLTLSILAQVPIYGLTTLEGTNPLLKKLDNFVVSGEHLEKISWELIDLGSNINPIIEHSKDD